MLCPKFSSNNLIERLFFIPVVPSNVTLLAPNQPPPPPTAKKILPSEREKNLKEGDLPSSSYDQLHLPKPPPLPTDKAKAWLLSIQIHSLLHCTFKKGQFANKTLIRFWKRTDFPLKIKSLKTP